MDKDIDKAIIEAKRKYFRDWRKKNPDKVKRHNENYWRKKAAELLNEKSTKGSGVETND